jgi:hypothetical protein
MVKAQRQKLPQIYTSQTNKQTENNSESVYAQASSLFFFLVTLANILNMMAAIQCK